MNWDRLINVVVMLLDAGILWILIEEFNYDKIIYEKDQYHRRKKKLLFEHLNVGEGR